ELVAGLRGDAEVRGVERREAAIEAVLARGGREERRDLRRVLALAAHAAAEHRVGEAAVARRADAGQHALLSLGDALLQPRDEDLVERAREPEQHPGSALRPGLPGGRE